MKKFWKNFRQFKFWLQDKYRWLKTFNNPPKVIINADCILGTYGKYAIESTGRTNLIIIGDIITSPGIEGKKWVHHKGDVTFDNKIIKDVTFIIYE